MMVSLESLMTGLKATAILWIAFPTLFGSTVLAQDTVRISWHAEIPVGTSYYSQNYQIEQCTHFGVDHSGNIYGAAHASQASNIVLVKYSASGDLLWTRTHNDFGLIWADVRAMAVDSAGTSVLAGIASVFPDTGGHGYLMSLSPEGQTNWFRWTSDLNPTGCEIIPVKILSDNSGLVYYLGSSGRYTLDPCNSFGFATAKFYPNGDTAWVRFEHLPMRTFDRPTDIRLDKSNSIYVCGTTYGGNQVTNPFNFLVIKYQSDGTRSWETRLDFSDRDEPFAMVVDDESNVYVTGEVEPDSIGLAYGTVKLSPDGTAVWTRFLATGYRDEQGPRTIAIDGSGDIIICGGGYSEGEYGFFTVKYTPLGDTLWTRMEHFNGVLSFSGYDRAVSFDLDEDNNIYVTGESVLPATIPRSLNIVTLKYGPNGEKEWVHFYDVTGGNTRPDYAKFVSARRNSAVIVGGISLPAADLPELVLFELEQVFRCGDIDGSGNVAIADAISLIQYLFGGGKLPRDLKTGDVNCDERVNLTDAVYLIHYIFSGGMTPCEGC